MADAKPGPQTLGAAGDAAAPPRKSKTWMMVAALMAIEGVAVFVVAKMLSTPPASVLAQNDASGEQAPSHEAGNGHDGAAGTHNGTGKGEVPGGPEDLAEVKLTESKTYNRETGKTIFLHIRVSALVAAADLERTKKLVEAKQGRIDDRINTVIRGSEPKHLNESGLETIKLRVKFECDRIFEEESLIREVLIPYFVQTGPGL